MFKYENDFGLLKPGFGHFIKFVVRWPECSGVSCTYAGLDVWYQLKLTPIAWSDMLLIISDLFIHCEKWDVHTLRNILHLHSKSSFF